MRHRNQKKRVYQVPQLKPTDVEFELSFVATVRLLMEVDELENINQTTGDAPDSDIYFEF